ncbi:MAG: molybdopterin biosynthesis protein [Humidesulfovibrio sp.]|uniref:molybdopterin biosynthesis protein n=1 Tax=Humidesulfovibrio sp. TaxID=2910988 RepID=UPI0027EF19C6|nr:molybdopterin biosynthesis protein [Humidesulfovibrio sp.]MDQ7835696.1 molybdopterin biosynthesis protein [Humidesulfovibrio sp.]
MSDRNVYLSTIPPEQAVLLAKSALDRPRLIREETIPAHEACGRVTSGPIFARCSSPTFHAAAMDGISVRSSDTFAAREGSPVTLKSPKSFHPVNTGHCLPEGMDAVVMIEHVEQVDDATVRIEAPAFPWQHVRRIGEDIVATELLLPQNHTLTPYDIGALLAAGIFEVPVWERVRLTFIPTGDEVLNFLDKPTPKPGQVIESNSQVFRSIAASWGALPSWTAPVQDRAEALQAAVRQALADGAHIVVVGAGSSAGSKDFTRSTFEAFGEVLCHGIAVMPGKPTVLGVTTDKMGSDVQGRLLVGAPGYPVSAVVCLEDVLEPVVRWLTRQQSPGRQKIRARLARKTPSRPGMEEIVRLAVGKVGEGFVAAPLARGAGLITSLTRAQAVTRIPAQSEGLEQDADIEAELLVPPGGLEKVLVHIGSHDNILDLLANELMGLPEPLRLVSSHVGSMGGLTALKNGSALFAGCHLFDPATKDFNFPFLSKHLPGLDLVVLNLAIRHQGLIVAKGNPKGIKGVADLARPEVGFINRQRGAGTRILLDHHLDVAGIAPQLVRGYDREEFTHMAVAVNVLTGAADCGLGIFAAAKALALDFAPLAHERYDLVFPAAYLDDPRIKTLRAVIETPQFQERMQALGGYETTFTGRLMTPGFGLGE